MTSWNGQGQSLSSDMICVKSPKADGIASTTASSSDSIGKAPQLTFIQLAEFSPSAGSQSFIVDCVVCRKIGNRPLTPDVPEIHEPDH